MKTGKLLAIASIVATLGLSSLYAQGNTPLASDAPFCDKAGMHKHHGAKRGDMAQMPMFAKLNLSDAQKESLKALRESSKMDRKNHHLMKKHGEVMAGAISEKGFDKAKFIQNSTKEFNAMINARADHMEKVFAVLTPAQKAQLASDLQAKK